MLVGQRADALVPADGVQHDVGAQRAGRAGRVEVEGDAAPAVRRPGQEGGGGALGQNAKVGDADDAALDELEDAGLRIAEVSGGGLKDAV